MCNAGACDLPARFDPTLSDGSHPNFHRRVQGMTPHQEHASQTEAQTQAPPEGKLSRWLVRLFGSGLLAITAAWVYLLALGIGYLWDQVF
jgi:hypothetical protein